MATTLVITVTPGPTRSPPIWQPFLKKRRTVISTSKPVGNCATKFTSKAMDATLRCRSKNFVAQLPTGLLVEITVLRFFKNGCHIGGDRVGPGVTVITSVVAIHVAEVCHERGAWIDRQKNLLENWIGNRDAIPSRIFRMRVV